MRTQRDEQLLPVLEMMMWFTAPRLDILQLPVCLELLLWIDGFTLLVFILRATSDCDLICVVHAGQWPVSRPEAALCHLSLCVISGLQAGRCLKSVNREWSSKLTLLWSPWRTLTDWLGMSNLTTSSVSERLIIYSRGVKRTKNLLLQANPVSFVIVWALEWSLDFPWPGYV